MKERDLSDPIQLTARELSTLTGVPERLLKEELKPTTPRTDGSVKMTIDDHGVRQISVTGPDKSTAQIRVAKEGDLFKLQGGSIQGAGGLTQLESPADVQHVARAMGNMKHTKAGAFDALAGALREGGVRDNVNDWIYKKGIEHYHAHAHEPMELKGIAGRNMTPREILERELQGFKHEVVRDKAGVVTGSTYTLTTEGRNPEKLVVHTNKNDVVDKVSFHPDTKTRIDLPPTKETQALVLDAAYEARTTRTSISEKIVHRANNQFRHHGIVKQPQTADDVLGKLAERHEAHVAKALPSAAAAQAKVAAAEVKPASTKNIISPQNGRSLVEDVRIHGLSNYDKMVLAGVQRDYEDIANRPGGVEKYIREARQKLDPKRSTYLGDVRKLEILAAYDSVASQVPGKIIPRTENKTGYDNFYKALHGETPTGMPLESQRYAAEKGRYGDMPDKTRLRFQAAAEVKGGATSAFKAASTQRGHAKVFVLAAVAAVALTALVGVKLWGGSPEQKKPAPPEAPKADRVNLDRLNNAARAAIGGGPAAAAASPTVHHEPKIGPQVIAPVKQRLGGPS